MHFNKLVNFTYTDGNRIEQNLRDVFAVTIAISF